MTTSNDQSITRANELFERGIQLSRGSHRRSSQAAAAFKGCLDLRQEVLGEEHLDTGRAMYHYALTLDCDMQERGYNQHKLLTEALQILNCSLPPGDEEIVSVLFALATHHKSMVNLYMWAEWKPKRPRDVDRVADGHRHQAALCYRCLLSTPAVHEPEILANIHYNLGTLLLELRAVGQAQTHFQEICRIKEELSSPGSDYARDDLRRLTFYYQPGSEEYNRVMERIRQGSPFKEAIEIDVAAQWWGEALRRRLNGVAQPDAKDRHEEWYLPRQLISSSSVDELVTRFIKALKLELTAFYISHSTNPGIQLIVSSDSSMDWPLRAALRVIGIDDIYSPGAFFSADCRLEMYIQIGRVAVGLGAFADGEVIYKSDSSPKTK